MDLQRMRKLAGILTEGVMQVPAIADSLGEEAPPGMEDMVMKLKKEYPNDHSKAFATAWSIYNKKHGKAEEGMMDEMGPGMEEGTPVVMGPGATDECSMEESSGQVDPEDIHRLTDMLAMGELTFDEFRERLDGLEATDHSMRQGEMGNPDMMNDMRDANDHDDYGQMDEPEDSEYDELEFEEAVDLNNGYDTEEYASGNDFFPNGADGPVVKSTGPSGARQGDNDEQKKMQVAEVHKELVYGYRQYISENSQTQKKS